MLNPLIQHKPRQDGGGWWGQRIAIMDDAGGAAKPGAAPNRVIPTEALRRRNPWRARLSTRSGGESTPRRWSLHHEHLGDPSCTRGDGGVWWGQRMAIKGRCSWRSEARSSPIPRHSDGGSAQEESLARAVEHAIGGGNRLPDDQVFTTGLRGIPRALGMTVMCGGFSASPSWTMPVAQRSREQPRTASFRRRLCAGGIPGARG